MTSLLCSLVDFIIQRDLASCLYCFWLPLAVTNGTCLRKDSLRDAGAIGRNAWCRIVVIELFYVCLSGLQLGSVTEVEPFQIPTPTYIHIGSEKVRAKTQLLFYYELYPDCPQPKTICSSKSGYYLCNLFFCFYGGFYVPRTHSRYYEK